MAFTCANLTAYWQLQESPGTARADSKGVNHLSEAPGAFTVNSATGLIGQAAYYSTGTSYLFRTSTTDLTWNGNVSFSGALWVNLASNAVQALLWKGTSATVEYRLNTLGAGGTGVRWVVRDSTLASHTLDTTAQLGTGAWAFLAFWYDQSALNMSINDGTPVTLAYTLGSYVGNQPLGVGASGDGGFILAAGGLLDEISLWNGYAFTAGDITTLYNGGAGYGYASICPATPIEWLQTKAMTPALRRSLLSQSQGDMSSTWGHGPGWGRLLSRERNRLVRS